MLQQIQGQQFICRLGFSPRARMYIFKFSREKNSTLFSISPSSEQSEELWVVCGFICRKWSCAIVVQAGHHHAQQIDRQSALQTAEKENTDHIPFNPTFHSHNHAVKSIVCKNFKLLQNDSETGTIFSQPPLISFKRDKNIGNFLVRSSIKTND